jgi:penicillin-binding protein 1A
MQPKRMAAYWFSRDGAVMALKLMGAGILVVFVVLIGLFAYFRKDLPKINDISGDNLGGSISYYDRTGTVLLWQDYDAVNRIAVSSNQITPYMKEATVAIEDKNFYKEGAFSVSGIFRAGIHDVFSGGTSVQGASTITEQLVKLNESWTGNRTIAVKVKELILAVDLEREYTKDQILTAYLNIAPYGGVDYGVDVAAQDYFGVSVNQLSLAQAALLAAIPQSPDYYSPWSPDFDKTAALDRQQYDLDQMARQGYITQAQADQAKAVDVLSEVQPQQSKYNDIQDPYFVLAAKQQLDNEYGTTTVNRGGWKVITTVNLSLQSLADKLVQANLPLVERNHGDQEAMVAEDVNTGQVVALVGGVDFSNPTYGQINYAETPLPPGSSFKPYDYSTLINDTNNVGAGSMLYDVEEPLPGYPCTNKAKPLQGGNCEEDYDFLTPGPEELRYALAGSRNIPAIKAMLSVVPNKQCYDNDLPDSCVPSIDKVISTADAMMDVPNAYQCYSDAARTQPDQCYASSAIGDSAYLTIADHANGLATLARMGQAIPQTFILKITDSNNKIIYNWTQPKPIQVLKPDTAYILNSILDDPNATYLPAGQKFEHYNGWDIAVKTGTTNEEYDALMTAWTTQYSVVSWVGYHTDNVALTAGLSEAVTEPLTKGWIEGALNMLNEKPVNWVQPSDIKVLPAYQQTKHIDYGDVEPGPTTDLYPSWYTGPALGGSKTQAQTIDKVSGGVATSCTPDLAKQTQQNQDVNEFSIDLFWPIGQTAPTSTSTTSTTSDNVHSCSDPALSNPTVSVDDSVTGNPEPDSSNNPTCPSGTCNIVVTPAAPPPPDNTMGSSPYPRYPITVNLLVGGQVIQTQTIASSDVYNNSLYFSYSPGGSSDQISVQLIDNAYYSVTTSTLTIDPVVAPTNPTNTQTNGNNSNNGNNPNL